MNEYDLKRLKKEDLLKYTLSLQKDFNELTREYNADTSELQKEVTEIKKEKEKVVDRERNLLVNLVAQQYKDQIEVRNPNHDVVETHILIPDLDKTDPNHFRPFNH